MKSEAILKIGNYGLHIIKNPAGTYSFVGSVPLELGEMVIDKFGSSRLKTPVFATEKEAIQHVMNKLPNEPLNLSKDGGIIITD